MPAVFNAATLGRPACAACSSAVAYVSECAASGHPIHDADGIAGDIAWCWNRALDAAGVPPADDPAGP